MVCVEPAQSGSGSLAVENVGYQPAWGCLVG